MQPTSAASHFRSLSHTCGLHPVYELLVAPSNNHHMQSKAKQSKAKQSKAKQSKAKHAICDGAPYPNRIDK
jgi:hypothetical protein